MVDQSKPKPAISLAPPLLIRQIGRLDPLGNRQAERVDKEIALAPFYPLVPVETARNPPISVVFTDWLSMITTLGFCQRPALVRTRG